MGKAEGVTVSHLVQSQSSNRVILDQQVCLYPVLVIVPEVQHPAFAFVATLPRSPACQGPSEELRKACRQEILEEEKDLVKIGCIASRWKEVKDNTAGLENQVYVIG